MLVHYLFMLLLSIIFLSIVYVRISTFFHLHDAARYNMIEKLIISIYSSKDDNDMDKWLERVNDVEELDRITSPKIYFDSQIGRDNNISDIYDAIRLLWNIKVSGYFIV